MSAVSKENCLHCDWSIVGFPSEMSICAWMPLVVAKTLFGAAFRRFVFQHSATLPSSGRVPRGLPINSLLTFTSFVRVKFTKSRIRGLPDAFGADSMYTRRFERERYHVGV